MMSLEKLASMVIRMSELQERIEDNCSTYLEQIELKNLRGKLVRMNKKWKTKQGGQNACTREF